MIFVFICVFLLLFFFFFLLGILLGFLGFWLAICFVLFSNNNNLCVQYCITFFIFYYCTFSTYNTRYTQLIFVLLAPLFLSSHIGMY